MTDYAFSSLTNGATIAFDPLADLLGFTGANDQASSVRVNAMAGGLSLTFGGKTVNFSGMELGLWSLGNIGFANGSGLVTGDGTTNLVADFYGQEYDLTSFTVGNQIWGLGGADIVRTGSGNDWIVGNTSLAALAHVSSANGVGATSPSGAPSVSADGRYVSFTGGWTAFGSQSDSGSTDIIVKDMLSGTFSNENKSDTGGFGAGSGRPVISADGNWVTFWANGQLQSGTFSGVWVTNTKTNEVKYVSEAADGTDGNNPSDYPDISADGRYVVFQSRATNLGPANGDATYDDIFLKDMQTGAVTRISTSQSGGDANGDCAFARISADGRYVVFQSSANNLTTAETGSGYIDIYLWDRETGKLKNLTAGGQTYLSNSSIDADVGSDGPYGGVVVFQTPKGLVASDTDTATDIYAYYIADGHFARVSTRADGSQYGVSSAEAAISADGRFVVFTANDASNPLTPGDSNGYGDVFVKDLVTGQIALVSKPADGSQANQASSTPEISAGGDFIVFQSSASNLASTENNGGNSDVFLVANPLLKDTLNGGAGDDTYVLNRSDIIEEAANGGSDTIRASFSYTLGANLENLVLTGTGNFRGTGNGIANTITGNTGANQLNGVGGNDVLIGGAGADTLDGGAGADVLVINAVVGTSSDSKAVVVAGSGNDTGQDKLANFNLAEDTIRVVATNVSKFWGGSNTYIGTAGAGGPMSLDFAANVGLIDLNGNGTLGDTGDIALTFITPSAALTESGFEARLQYFLTGTAGADDLLGGDLNDTISGGNGNDSLKGSRGNDTLDGGGGADELLGGTGDDTMTGGASADILNGSAGNDTYVVALTAAGALEDTVTETTTTLGEIDTLRLTGASTNSTPVTIALTGSLANVENIDATATGTSKLNLDGNGVDNTLLGNSVGNSLRGFAGHDVLDGQGGADRLIGGGGQDLLTGGAGNDKFVFGVPGDTGITDATWDTIVDFVRGQDKIDLSGIDADKGTATNDPFTALIASGAAFTAAGQLKLEGGVLYGNIDADATAEFAIEMTGITTLSLSDFVL